MSTKLWPILFILLLFGCDSSRLYEQNSDFKNKIWSSGDIKTFDFNIPDASLGYNIYFNVRNTMDYPHYNLYLSYHLKDSLNQILKEDLKSVNLFDPKTGKPEGKSSLGNIFDHRILVLENFKFESPGKKELELQQFMRYDSLPEIVSAGIRVEFYGKKQD